MQSIWIGLWILWMPLFSVVYMCNSYVYLCIYIIIRYWMLAWFCLSVCSFAIETTFPLSNLKTKHIFGILISLQKLLKLWGAPIFFSPSFTDAEGGAKWPPGAPYRREKSRRRRVFREYDHMEVKIGNIFIVWPKLSRVVWA